MKKNIAIVAALAALSLVLMAGGAHAAGAQLTVKMSVDHSTVEPGGGIEYRIVVKNVGDAPASQLEITSHIPTETHEDTQNCPQGQFEPDGDICLQADFPTPGAGEPVHQISHTFGPGLNPGQSITLVFAVEVELDATVGRVLFNHAHAQALLVPSVTSNTVQTEIVALCPGPDPHPDNGNCGPNKFN